MCSNYMARLDVANEEWHNCEGPALSRLHAGVTGSAGGVVGCDCERAAGC